MKLAIIDFDGTLFPRDTIPFLMTFWLEDGQSRIKHKLTMAKIMPYYYLYKLSFGNKKIKEGFRTHALKMFNRIFDGMSQDEVEGILERAGKKIRVILRPSILEELEKLKQDDYQIVLLSGAYENLLRACTYDLPFDHVIGSKLSFKDQVYRADAGLSMIEGRHKVQVIDRHFELGEQDWTQATAYGDSITDVELLHRVGNPVMVAPDEQLAQTGTERNWRRID